MQKMAISLALRAKTWSETQLFFVSLQSNIVIFCFMKTRKVLFITQGIMPYVQECTVSQWGRRIPQFVQEHGREIRTFMPKWGTINERRCQLHEVIRLSGMNLIIDETDHLLILKVASIPSARMQVYFIDNDDYFMRRLEEVDENGVEYPDNGERAIFYARGVLETVKKLRWVPDIIHCQGWSSAIAPMYVKVCFREEPSFRDCRIVFTPGGGKLTLPLTQQFRNSLQFKGMTGHELDAFPDVLTEKELMKLALNYSDALLLMPGYEDPELSAYAQELGLPVEGPLDIHEKGASDKVTNFFDSIWSQGKPDIETNQ